MDNNITSATLPELFYEQDYIKLCEKWKSEVSEPDPISMDNIPPEFLLRFRLRISDTNTVLISRDVRTLKELLERCAFENKQFIDPVSRIPYGVIHIKIINEHRIVKTLMWPISEIN